MKPATTTLRAREFARQAGVTVRTLHHYDRLGLIRPRRTQTRYRVYEPGDLETLHLIRVLKFVGLSLKTIKELTNARPDALLKAVRDQRGVLDAKRAGLEQAIGALADLEQAATTNRKLDDVVLKRIIETLDSQEGPARVRQYQYRLRAKMLTMTRNLDRMKQYAALYQEIDAARNDDPSSPRSQELAKRWLELGIDPTGLDPQLVTEARAMFAEAFASASANGLRPFISRMGDPNVRDFMAKALAIRQAQDTAPLDRR